MGLFFGKVCLDLRLVSCGLLGLFLAFQDALGQVPSLPAPPPSVSAPGSLAEAGEVFVHSYRFVGNTAFSDAELAQVLAPFAGRRVTSDDLEGARRALTTHYVRHGFITSGAVLEDQVLTNGIVEFRLVEGRLAEIDLEGTHRLRPKFIRGRLARQAQPPVSMNRLQEGLLQLKENRNIRRVNAELMPAEIPGLSVLNVRIDEANPWHASLEIRNDRPPSVGGEVLETVVSHSNLSGHSDELAIRYSIAHRARDGAEFSGLDDWGASYTVPLTPRDLTLRLYYNRNDFAVLDEVFTDLDIRSEAVSYGFSLREPVYKRTHRELSFGLIAERRETRTFLLGEPFSFSAGAVDGASKETVLRFFQEWIEHRQSHVLAFRSTVSWGIGLFDATTRGSEPDATFASWLGQAQYLRRLGRTQNQLVLNTVAQWSPEPLLSLEQFSIGGSTTVRGYPENYIIRDGGILASAELRIPVFTSATGASLLTVAPFVDYGRGWNARGSTPQPSDLASAGFGVLFNPHRRVQGRIYWGHPFRSFDHGTDDLQDYGIHFGLGVSLD